MALIVRRLQDPFRPRVAVTHAGPMSCPNRPGHLPLVMSAALVIFTGSASAARDGSAVEHGMLPTKDLSAFADTY
jgi:hypothetical protein